MNPNDSNRRTGVRYQPDEKPPIALTFGLGLQLAILSVAATVLVPAIIIRAAGGTESYLSWAVFAAVAVCGATTVLQAVRFGQIGSGYVLLMSISGASIAVSITALAEGGGGDARHPGRRLLGRPARAFRAALAAPANPDADGHGNGHHADTGHGDVARLQYAEGRAGRGSGSGRSAERLCDRTRHRRQRPERDGGATPLGTGHRRRRRFGSRRDLRPLRHRPRD